MNCNLYKLVVSDLDGTLLKYGSTEISSAVKCQVERLEKMGIGFTVATGRGWGQTESIVQSLGLTLPVILHTGAVIYDPVSHCELHLQPLRKELRFECCQFADLTAVDCFCLSADGIYYTTTVQTKGGFWLTQKSGETCRIGAMPPAETDIVKHILIGPEKQLKEVANTLTALKNFQPNLVLWPPEKAERDWFLEIFDPLASKGQALRWLTDRLRIDLKTVIAIGDGHNDLDILRDAGYGVAVASAPVEVKAGAKQIIPGPEEDGVARFLENELKVG